MIRYLIWDVDGTLFDTYPSIVRAFGEALSDLRVSAPLDWIDGLARVSLSHCVSALAKEFGLEQKEIESGFVRYYRQVMTQEQPPFPGVAEVCEYVVATGGANVIVTHRGRESTMALLTTHDMTTFFADILAGDDGYPRKPDPAALEALIARHGFARKETLAIGDRELDILAGQRAGIRTCLFGAGLDTVAPDFAIANYAELLQLITAESSLG